MKKSVKLIGIALFIYILSRINWSELIEVFREMNGIYFVFALLFIFPTIIVRTLKWRDIVQTLESREFPFWSLFSMYLKALSLGLVTPGKIGEFYRARYLSQQYGVSFGKALWTVVVERGVDFLTDAIVAVAGIAVLFFVFGVEVSFLGILFLLVLMILSIVFFTQRNFARALFEIAIKPFLPVRMKKKAEEFLKDFLAEMWILNRSLLWRLFVYDAFGLVLVVGAHFLIAISLSIPISFWYLSVALVLVGMLTILPISVLGIGVREAGYIFFFSLVGLTIEQALAFSLLALFWSISFRISGFALLYGPIKSRTA